MVLPSAGAATRKWRLRDVATNASIELTWGPSATSFVGVDKNIVEQATDGIDVVVIAGSPNPQRIALSGTTLTGVHALQLTSWYKSGSYVEVIDDLGNVIRGVLEKFETSRSPSATFWKSTWNASLVVAESSMAIG